MNAHRTALEQDVIDYIEDVQEIHEKALQYFNTMSEIRVLLLRMQDRSQELQRKLLTRYIPETATQKLLASSGATGSNETNQNTSICLKRQPSKGTELGVK